MEKRKRFMRACMVFLLAVLIAISSDMPVIQAQAAGNTGKSKILIAYFGRYGNTNFSKNVDATSSASIVLNSGKKQGTTEYLARQIQKQVGGDLFRIQTKKKYPANFNKLVDKNHDELDRNYLPALKTKVKKMKQYDIIFIGYPIWATDVPQAVRSFIKAYNLEGKTVIPFCTHEGSGQSGTYKQIRKQCSGADTLDGFSVNAEKVKTKSTQKKLKSWLNRVDVKSRSAKAVPITITIGKRKLNGVCYNTSLGKQIMKKFIVKVNKASKGKVLVAYFSATGTTKGVAKKVAK